MLVLTTPVLQAVDRDTVAVIVNTPHNPTGSVMVPGEVARLSAALPARGVPLIVDEVYHPLYFGEPLPSTAGIENVLVMSDLSKVMSLPGLRKGWIIDPDTSRRPDRYAELFHDQRFAAARAAGDACAQASARGAWQASFCCRQEFASARCAAGGCG